MSDLISIIIPVFNCESYIERCLNSIVNQDYKNLQIIVINDGSTDHTLEKASLIEDNRIQLITTQNIGVSRARNMGLSLAVGDYVMFVDADDWLNPHAVQVFLNAIHKYNYDFIISEYSREICVTNLKVYYSDEDCQTLSSAEACRKIINPFGFYGSVWAKIFNNEIINRYNLKFNEQIEVGEDLLFTFNYLKCSNKVGYLNVETYNYYNNKNSVLNTISEEKLNRRMDILKVYEILLSDLYLYNQKCYSRTVAIYTRELCDWYSVAKYFNEEVLANNLRRKIQRYFKLFLRDHTFSKKTKLAALIKVVFPKFSRKMMENKI